MANEANIADQMRTKPDGGSVSIDCGIGEQLERWLSNLELELSGASLAPLEGFVLGGNIFTLEELRGMLSAVRAFMQDNGHA